MAKKSLYLRFEKPDEKGKPIFVMRKFDEDQDPLQEYKIREEHGGAKICDCPAVKPDCRHKKMLPIFDKAERGEDPLYNKVSEDGRYQCFLSFDGRLYNWIQGPEKQELD